MRQEDVARLQIDLAGAGLGGDQLGVGDVHQHPVDIGQLLALLVDAMEVRIAQEHELLRRRANRIEPGLQGRQFRVVEIVKIVAVVVQSAAQPRMRRLRAFFSSSSGSAYLTWNCFR